MSIVYLISIRNVLPKMKIPYLCHTISDIEVDIYVNCNFSLATIQFKMQCLSRWAGGLNTYMSCV